MTTFDRPTASPRPPRPAKPKPLPKVPKQPGPSPDSGLDWTLTDDQPVPFTVTLAAYAALNHHDRFTQIHTAYRDRVEAFIASRLARPDWQLAQDIASEVFIHLWRWHIARGKSLDDRTFGLLATISRQYICAHLRRSRSTEVAVDFTDPAATVARTAAAPASVTPHLAVLYSDLEQAKDELTEAARIYRAAKQAAASAQGGLSRAATPEAVARCTARVQALTEARDTALADFRAAAARVAELRNAWNTAADNTPMLGVTR